MGLENIKDDREIDICAKVIRVLESRKQQAIPLDTIQYDLVTRYNLSLCRKEIGRYIDNMVQEGILSREETTDRNELKYLYQISQSKEDKK